MDGCLKWLSSMVLKSTIQPYPGLASDLTKGEGVPGTPLFNSLSIYKFGLSVCLFVSNKRQNGWTDRAQIFCGTSRDPREGLWLIEILNICLHQNSIAIKFLKILKIREFFVKIRELFLFCFTMYTKRTCSQLI